jgi:hypothetical protein
MDYDDRTTLPANPVPPPAPITCDTPKAPIPVGNDVGLVLIAVLECLLIAVLIGLGILFFFGGVP